jgi:hypothetical protein
MRYRTEILVRIRCYNVVEITNTMHKFATLLYSYMLAPTRFGSSLPCLRTWTYVLRMPAYIMPQYYPILSHSPFYLSTTLDTCFISYVFYHILTRCTSCCYFVILSLVLPVFITSFNLFYSTPQGALHTDSLSNIHILDKPPYRSVFSRNSDGSRSSLKMADYCRNM